MAVVAASASDVMAMNADNRLLVKSMMPPGRMNSAFAVKLRFSNVLNDTIDAPSFEAMAFAFRVAPATPPKRDCLHDGNRSFPHPYAFVGRRSNGVKSIVTKLP